MASRWDPCNFSCPASTVTIQPPPFVVCIPGPSLSCPDQPFGIEQYNPCAPISYGGGYRPLPPSSGPCFYPPPQQPGYCPPLKPPQQGYCPPPKPPQQGYCPPPKPPQQGYCPPPKQQGCIPCKKF